MEKTLVLNHKQVNEKIIRLSYQILEDCYDQETIVFAGIEKRGFLLAKRIHNTICQLTDKKIVLGSLKVEMSSSEKAVSFDKDLKDYSDAPIILIDDVANSGATLFYALKLFMNHEFKKLRLAVLVDREHKKFPISPDFVGYTLSTTLQEHIDVEFKADAQIEVYLN